MRALLFISLLILVSCATYQNKVADSRNLLEQGQVDKALEKLKTLAEKEDGDQLVYLLDYGSALEFAGQMKESNEIFLKADKLAELQDYHSASRVAGSMLFNEEMVQYKGDTFEKIFINAFLAMNYLQMGMTDDAMVETRRMNEKYVKLRSEDKKNFELNPYAKYLSAVIWEADQKWDDAAIAYEEAYKLDPRIYFIKEDLIRSSKKARRQDSYDSWKKSFPEIVENPDWYNKDAGELVVIYQQGWGPRKAADPRAPTYPILRPVRSQTQRISVALNGAGQYPSQFVYDTESAAIKTLADDRASLIARRVGGLVAKNVVADQVRQKNELLGAIAYIGMRASDRADLRQWSTLPQTIQMVRTFLKPGTYSLKIQGLASAGFPTADSMGPVNITIRPGQKTFVNYRSLR